jgi:hypothetical protein
MSLDAARQNATAARRNARPLDEVFPLARQWFAELKLWETNETWQRAFADGRMTATSRGSGHW